VPVLVLARHPEPGRHLPLLQGDVSAMSRAIKKKVCYRCRMPAPEPEHLYVRGDGRRFCMPCLVLLSYDAEVIEANRALDAWVERQSKDRP
jgi:hypothetical protein